MKQNDDIREYARGDRRGKAANRLERQAVDDPFLHEALEGYRAVEGDLSADIDRLERQIARRAEGSRRRQWLAVAAASVAVMLSLCVWLWQRPADEPAEQLAMAPRSGQVTGKKQDTAAALARDSAASPRSEATDSLRKIVAEAEAVEAQAVLAVATAAGNMEASAKQAAPTPPVEPVADTTIPRRVHEAAKAALLSTQPPTTASKRQATAHNLNDKETDTRLLPWVCGMVTDTLGRPLPGVTVLAKGTTAGTATDAAGRYRLELSQEADTLVYSFVGMKTRKLPVRRGDSLTVALTEEWPTSDIVVTGYQSAPPRRSIDSIVVKRRKPSQELAEVNVRGYAVVARHTVTAAMSTVSATPLDSFASHVAKRLGSLGTKLLERGVDELKVRFQIDADGRITHPQVRGSLSTTERRTLQTILCDAPAWDEAWRGKQVRGSIRLWMTGNGLKAEFVPNGRTLRKAAARPALSVE